MVEERELSVKADTAEFTQSDGIGLPEAQIYASGGPKRQRKLEEERAQGAGDEEERPNSLVPRQLAHFRQCSMAASAAQASCGGRDASRETGHSRPLAGPEPAVYESSENQLARVADEDLDDRECIGEDGLHGEGILHGSKP
ncbi:MAG: hypothetical protein HW398_727 [Acidobacteria bacterium]|nr:hypothetical protein [Acidobacteriota bacterium]